MYRVCDFGGSMRRTAATGPSRQNGDRLAVSEMCEHQALEEEREHEAGMRGVWHSVGIVAMNVLVVLLIVWGTGAVFAVGVFIGAVISTLRTREASTDAVRPQRLRTVMRRGRNGLEVWQERQDL